MPVRHTDTGRTPDRVADRPTWILSRACARSSALLMAGFEAHGDGLRGYHFRLLAALEQWGPASQADLSRDTGIDRSDVTAVLNELEARRYVEREVDPGNKRRNIVTLTPLGAEALVRLDAVLEEIQEAVLAPLTAAQRRQFISLLSRLT
jgi:MarR family transcriptional regulator, lower aerobic nicotinate degradation pathway regulator